MSEKPARREALPADEAHYTNSAIIHGNFLRRKPSMVKLSTSLPFQSVARLKQLAMEREEDMNRLLALGIDLLWAERTAE